MSVSRCRLAVHCAIGRRVPHLKLSARDRDGRTVRTLDRGRRLPLGAAGLIDEAPAHAFLADIEELNAKGEFSASFIVQAAVGTK